MRTYSVPALILATIGTGLLSGFFLIGGLRMMPDLQGVAGSDFQSELNSANQSIEGTSWYWIVVTMASAAIVLAIGAMLTKIRVHHQLPGRLFVAVALLICVQFLLDMAGLHTLETAFARVQPPLQSGVSEGEWAAPERERILLAGAAVVSLIYAVALCVQIAHDNRGTRSP